MKGKIKYIFLFLFFLFFIIKSINHRDFETYTQKIHKKDEISVDIEINEDSSDDEISIETKLYDDKSKFIENAQITLNTQPMKFSKVTNGFYGYWRYYYISTYDYKELFEDIYSFKFNYKNTKEFVFKKTPKINNNDIIFKSNQNGIKVSWKNLKIMDKLKIEAMARVNNSYKSNILIISTKIAKEGEYSLNFKQLDKSISDIEYFSFYFSGTKEKKLDDVFNSDSKIKHNREYNKFIHLK